MAVETTQSANAAAPAGGASTAAATAAPTPTAAAPILSFEDMVAAELGPEPSAKVSPETTTKRSKPATAASAGADPDNDDDDQGNDDGDDDGAPAYDEDGDGSGEGHAGDPDAPGADGGNGDDTAPPDEPDENAEHEDLPPEHFKKLPKWAQKRLGKQSAALKTAREELAVRAYAIAPTPASPLAHVESLEELRNQVDLAKQVRTWCKENPDGGAVGKVEMSPEDVAARLAHAESVIEAAPDWQGRLSARAQAKPWEAAKRICPELFQPGTEEQRFGAQALEQCPELKLKLSNWEMFLAAAIRSIKQVKDEAEGKAKYVRMEMKDGKVVPPSKPAGSQKPGTKPAPQAGAAAGTSARPPVSPGGSTPPLRATRGAKPDTSAIEARYQKTRDPDDFAALVAASLG